MNLSVGRLKAYTFTVAKLPKENEKSEKSVEPGYHLLPFLIKIKIIGLTSSTMSQLWKAKKKKPKLLPPITDQPMKAETR